VHIPVKGAIIFIEEGNNSFIDYKKTGKKSFRRIAK